MKWILIALNLSNWDGSVVSRIEVAEFTTQRTCMDERDRVEQSEGTGAVRFVCSEEPQKDK